MKNSNINTGRKYFPVLLSFIAMMSINGFTQTASGQAPYKVVSGSQVTVSGKSNLHDWTMLASAFSCEGIFTLKGTQLQDISALSFTLPVTNMKSKEKLMDTRAYKALKSDEFSKITFRLTQAVVTSGQKNVRAIGNLTIAGVTKEISVRAEYVLNDDGSITLTGSEPIKMSDFNMKAPSFMLGALKVGNEVTINILLKLKKSSFITQTN